MSDTPNLKPQTTTKVIRTKYVSFYSPQGLQAGPFTLYMDTDKLQENDFGYRIVMAARPDAPQLQRPLEETIVILKVNMFYKQAIDSEAEIDVLVNTQPS